MAEESEKQILSEQEVWDVLAFAQAMNGLYPGVFTPQLINARLKDITLTSGITVSESTVESALNDPKNSEKQLLGLSEGFEYKSTSYKRILQYMANLPAWDLTYYCKNIKEESDYKSPAYRKDLDEVKRFLDCFDYKKEFSTVVKQLFREETFFSVLRDEGEKYVLQQLPSDYCLITGRWDYSPVLFSFNYMWFQQGGIDIDMYPSVFKETYQKLFIDSGNKRIYDPSIPVDLRRDSTWVMYGDCSPEDGFWGWKLSPELAARIPYFAGLFPDFANQSTIRSLQKSNYMAAAAKILFGEIDTLAKEQKAARADTISLNPVLLGNFLGLVKNAINNEAVKIGAAPMQNVQGFEFTADHDIYSSWLHTTLGASGVNSNLLFSGDTKPNAIETQLSANVDEMVANGVYPYFNNFLEYQINKRTKKFKFGFCFEGSNFYLDKQRRFDTQMKLMDKGIVNPQKLAASLGQNPFVFQAQLDEARANGWADKLTPIISSFNMGIKDVSGGRPKKSDGELGESGSETRDSAGNVGRGGKE